MYIGPNSRGGISISEFLTFVIERLSTRESAGIIRAALKLGATDPNALRPYEDYRSRIAATVENIFKDRAKKKIRTKEIREAIQIVFASINDAALMPQSAAMKLGSNEMTNALCEMAAAHVGIKADFIGKIARTKEINGNAPGEDSGIRNAEPSPNKKQPAKRTRGKVRVL